MGLRGWGGLGLAVGGIEPFGERHDVRNHPITLRPRLEVTQGKRRIERKHRTLGARFAFGLRERRPHDRLHEAMHVERPSSGIGAYERIARERT